MQNPRRVRGAVLTIALMVEVIFGALQTNAAPVQPPTWVPEKYARFFYRRVDDRPAWQRALGYLDISVGQPGQSFALVAGISKYPNIGGRAGNLFPARIDVEKMASYLAREPESFNEIVVLLDEDVTAENLRYFLTQYFPRRLSESPRSRFLFAYSGHGMTASNGRGYLLTSEAKSLSDRFGASISLATLRAEFQEVIDAGHQVLALINACYGVDFHRLSLAFGPETTAPLPTLKGAHAITAGGAGEVTWYDPSFGDGDGPKGSIFFEAVLAALEGRADQLPHDGIVTVGELETYLRTTVSRFTDEKQNPTGDDLISERSPGGFFFLDRSRQEEHGNAAPLKGEWWASLSFGNPVGEESRPSGTSAAGSAPPPDRPLPPVDLSTATPESLKASLGSIGIDSSLPDKEFLGYLANSEFTSYPAIAKAALDMIGREHLKQPVYFDVIVWFYEESQGGAMPHEASDVDVARLRTSIVAAYNARYGSAETGYKDIVLAAPSEAAAAEGQSGWIGLSSTNVTPEIAKQQGLKNTSGVKVTGVLPDGPADRAGVKAGDIIVRLDGVEIRDARDLAQRITQMPAGKSVVLELIRSGHTQTASLTTDVRPSTATLRFRITPLTAQNVAIGSQAVSVVGPLVLMPTSALTRKAFSIADDVSGMVVTAVLGGRSAQLDNLSPGEVIMLLNDRPAVAADDVSAVLSSEFGAGRETVYFRLYVPKKGGWRSANLEASAFDIKPSAVPVETAFSYDRGDGVPKNPELAALHLLAALQTGKRVALSEVDKMFSLLSPAARQAVQRYLADAGLYRGRIDGVSGAATLQAMIGFIEQSGG